MTPGKVLHRVVDSTQKEICRCDTYDQAEMICRAVSASPEAAAFAEREGRLLASVDYLKSEQDKIRKHFQAEISLHLQGLNAPRATLDRVCPLGSECKCKLFAAEPNGKGCGFERRQRGES